MRIAQACYQLAHAVEVEFPLVVGNRQRAFVVDAPSRNWIAEARLFEMSEFVMIAHIRIAAFAMALEVDGIHSVYRRHR